MIKKKIKRRLPESFWICEGCKRKVNSYLTTTIGFRCLNCVVNNNLTFLLEDEKGYLKEWVKAKWTMNGKEITSLPITKETSEQQTLNNQNNISTQGNKDLSLFLPT